MQKHIVTTIILLASFVALRAQPVKDGEPVNGVSYKSIGTFQASSVADKVVFILDTLRGGTFTLYSGNMPADGGIIIQNANGKKYIRQISGNEVNLLWWGAAAEDGKFDNRPALLACINAVQAISQDDNWAKNPYFLKKYKIYIPGAAKKYFISGDSLLITNTIRLEGDAGYTRLSFAKKGLVFSYPGAAGSVVNGISLYGSINYNNPDTTWYGIRVKCQVDFREVEIRQFYNGLEVLADAAVKPEHPMYGNSNNSLFRQIHCVQNGGNGIYVKGGDANNISFEQVDVVANTLWGVCDQNFLGNTYTMGHSASNASPELPYNKTIAIRKGVIYAAVKNGYLPDPAAPGSEVYWWKWGDSARLYQPYPFPYNPKKFYRSGGAYNLDGENVNGENQRSALLNCYSEADQPASYVGQSSFILGGDHGAGIRRGAYLGAYNNHLYSTSKFTIGMEGSNRVGILDSNYIRIQSGYVEGIGMSYDPQTKMGTLGYPPYESAFQNIYFTTPQTPPALLNRSGNTERSVIIPNGIYTGEMENNNDYRRIFRTRTRPDAQKLENGDVALARHKTWTESPDDVFGYTKNAAGTVVNFKGYAEYEVSTTDGKQVIVLSEPVAVGSSQAYELVITAQSGGTATYYCRKEWILSRNPGGTASLVMPVRDVTPEYRSPGMGKGIGPVVTTANGGLTLSVIGETGKTYTWKIQVRRT